MHATSLAGLGQRHGSSIPVNATGCRRPAAPTAAPGSSSRLCSPAAVCYSHRRDLEPQQPDWCTRLASVAAAAMVAGASLFCNPAGTPPAAAAIPGAPEGNSAILGQLKRRQQTQQRYGTTSDPAVALSDRFTAVQDQLQRIRLLVQLGDFDNARLVMRNGAFSALRGDLRYESEYRGVNAEVARSVVEGVEQLDRRLRQRESLDTIKPVLEKLQQQLQDISQAGQQ